MKFIHIIATVVFPSALMGYQIEITPLAAVVTTDVVTENSGNTTNINEDSNTGMDTSTAVTLYWSAPLVRDSGKIMKFSEIDGYEIRYKMPADVVYQSEIINDASVEQYSFDSLDNVKAYRFEVAAFDVNGIYSEFMSVD